MKNNTLVIACVLCPYGVGISYLYNVGKKAFIGALYNF